MVSQMNDCTVEDLTVVVLAHEMAHAYTAAGGDATVAGGVRDCSVKRSPHSSKDSPSTTRERTEATADALPHRARSVLAPADEKAAPYHAHESWAPHVAPEAVRRAMLEVRRSGELTLAEFEKRLAEAAKEFVLMPARAD